MNERQKRLIEVYEHLRRYFGIHTKTGFAEAIQYGRTSMSAAMNGDEKYLTDSLFKNICAAFPGVFNIDYLLNGHGDLLTQEDDAKTETIRMEDKMRSPLVDIDGIVNKAVEIAVSAKDETINVLKSQVTDLWIFDYIGDVLQQSVHQASTDATFGSPSLSLDYGDHTFYFVASRGSDPVIDTDAKTITWGSVRDTFHGSLSLNVQPNSGSSQSVSLSRCVGRLRVSATDVVPEGAAKLVVSPSSWYYGLNYQSGEGVADSPTPLVVNIPNSYIGTTKLAASFYTISGTSPWQTDMTVALVATDESTIGSVTISDVTLQRNHVTSYTGGIVGAGRTLNLGSDDEWVEDETVSW